MAYNRNVEKYRSKLLDSNSDTYLGSVAKCIPTEIIGGYLTVVTLLNSGPLRNNHIIAWSIFIFCCLLTPIYLWRLYRVVSPIQLLISAICFIVWAMAIGSPIEYLFENSKILGGIFTPLLSLTLPLLVPYKND